ncbi:MAG: type II toxin-antitoxin system RelE/ParE family toxin [Candidatus Omnitrophica bacterium]|nr:type II toxin-antitoxin system RelE/ParE family toxin [Candidatus Omnitrophota bacterium]
MKKYKLELTRQAEASLEKIARSDTRLYKRVVQIFESLQQDPFQGKPLKGRLKGRYSYRVGTYRIIYAVFRNQLLITVIDIGHRRDIYR